MDVSAATERKLREAMQRLLDGVPLRTDGAITKENLAREADVSHASVYRAKTVLAEWDAKVALPIVRSVGEVRRDETIAELQTKLRTANRRITELNGKLDALASVTANLYHENRILRSKLDQRSDIAALPGEAPERQAASIRPSKDDRSTTIGPCS
jgi:predicted RNase H-like nuclease (RuvC/YqgF family)